MLKKLALAVMIVCGAAAAQNVTAPATLDPGQIYNTGNIVQPTTTTTGSTWVNGVYQDQLTCWGWGDPGYCGPNAIVRPGGNINFSFGTTDLYQVQAIASVLPGGGSGLRVNGYNFGFMAKNGNGWDGGGLDTLSAYVNIYGSDGKSVRNDYYDLNWKFDWTTFNYSKTFDTPYAAKDLSTVQYGFVGRDNNFWAGPYGPEITNVSFGLKYSVDPCATNPLYSPTCPGYMDALNKLLPPPVVVEPVVTTTLVAPTTTIADPVSAPTSVSTAPTSQPSVVAPAVSAPAPTAASSTTAPSTSANNRENSGANNAQAMSIIGRNQERDRETLSVAQSAVSAAATAAVAAQQEAVSVATAAVANSTNNNAVSGSAANNTGPGFRSTAAANNAASQTSAFQLMSGISVVTANSPQLQNILSATTGSSSTAETTTVTPPQSAVTSNSGLATVESNVAVAANFLTDRTSPINNVIEQRLAAPASTAATTGPSVNTRASDNEAAGNVSIATMAVAPIGYGDYLNFSLRDAAFYAPREVYRNQRTVDNARALRQLTNDSRHREMVEQQYRR